MVDFAKIDYTDCIKLAESILENFSEKECRALCIELLAAHYEDSPESFMLDSQDYKDDYV